MRVYWDYGNAGTVNPIVGLWLDDDDKVYATVRDKTNHTAQAVSATTVSEGEWAHLTMTWDHAADKVAVYINGVFEDDDTNASMDDVDVLENHPPQVGRYALQNGSNHDFGGYFDGLIDEVQLFDRVLTTTEIATTYQMELDGDEDGLFAHYELNNNGDDSVGSSDLISVGSAPFGSYTNQCHGT